MKIKLKKHIVLILVIVFLVTASSYGNVSLGAETNLQVHIIDVGQGDSIIYHFQMERICSLMEAQEPLRQNS